MPRREEVKNLLTNMQSAIGPDSLHRRLDLAPYKVARAWPGKPYLLIGNSYNAEKAVRGRAKKRTAAISALLAQAGARNCVKIADALRDDDFANALSRFEYDWLKREHASTLIGPAYDEHGDVLPQSFAVWRRLHVSKPTDSNKTLVLAALPS